MSDQPHAFAVGDPVVKDSADSRFAGEVACVFAKRVRPRGALRYVVENAEGTCHVFHGGQLALDGAEAARRSRLAPDPWRENAALAAEVCAGRLLAELFEATDAWRRFTIPQVLDAARLALEASRAKSQAEFDGVATRLRALFERPHRGGGGGGG